jgi:beta-lactamase superfamily II metal-dependent hydrolase
MYNPGFGDAFVVTVRNGKAVWRMLVDCGVHTSGVYRPIEEVVGQIIADLTAEKDDPAHLNAVALTHHHRDHMSGFAEDGWEKIRVDEVWLSYVEDDKDPTTMALLAAQKKTMDGVAKMVAAASATGSDAEKLRLAGVLAANTSSSVNDRAIARLKSKTGFAGSPRVRYLPSLKAAQNVIELPVGGAVIHALGPSRDPRQLRRMDPPAAQHWLQALADRDLDDQTQDRTLFASPYLLPKDSVDPRAREHVAAMELDDVLNQADSVLAAASAVEGAVNNSSLVFLLEVAGRKLLFVGDSQQGAWEHLLNDPATRSLMGNLDFYKIGHHGSHNATPKDFVSNVMGAAGSFAMMPFSTVKNWPIPNDKLLDKLREQNASIVRADEPNVINDVTVRPGRKIPEYKVQSDVWTQITLQGDE